MPNSTYDGPPVHEPADLTPIEKETQITFAKDQDRFLIGSEHASIVKWLLRHPEFERRSVQTNGEAITSVTGTLPIGTLKLQGASRKSNLPSSVTGTFPKDVEPVAVEVVP